MKPKFPLKELLFDLHASRDEKGAISLPVEVPPPVPSHLQKLWGTVTVVVLPAAKETNERLQLLKEQVEHRCPVSSMILASGCKTDVVWKFGESTSL